MMCETSLLELYPPQLTQVEARASTKRYSRHGIATVRPAPGPWVHGTSSSGVLGCSVVTTMDWLALANPLSSARWEGSPMTGRRSGTPSLPTTGFTRAKPSSSSCGGEAVGDDELENGGSAEARGRCHVSGKAKQGAPVTADKQYCAYEARRINLRAVHTCWTSASGGGQPTSVRCSVMTTCAARAPLVSRY